jgi:NADPH2:quinone reductase
MNAILMTAPGSPESLQFATIDEPQIQKDTQVKVRLMAAGVNPIDTKIRQRGLFFADAFPAILGCDGAGVISEVGAAVVHYHVGDEVYFCHGGLGREPGNYAQFTVLEAAHLSRKPQTLNYNEAAAAPLVMITAWEALFDRAHLQPQQTVLIHAGAGGVGHVAIQLAKHTGARVITTVSDPLKAEFVKTLGADVVILYPDTDFVQACKQLTSGRGVDVAVDTVGGEVFRKTLHAVAQGGEVVTLLDPGTDIAWKEARRRNLRIGFEFILTPLMSDLPEARQHQVAILNKCAELIDRGDLSLEISKVFDLADAAAAHVLLEAGHMQGKLVLNIPH